MVDFSVCHFFIVAFKSNIPTISDISSFVRALRFYSFYTFNAVGGCLLLSRPYKDSSASLVHIIVKWTNEPWLHFF